MVPSNPSIQLRDSLRFSSQVSAATQRPRLLHLNADTTWLLRLPYPLGTPSRSQRSHFNILIDPWLRGRQSDVASWFSSQWHAIESSVQTIAELNQLLQQNEAAQSDVESNDLQSEPSAKVNHIDAVVVSHEFTDHCHKATLLEVDPTTPVFATSKAAELIRSWKHFRKVFEPVPFSKKMPDWRESSLSSLPDWLAISRIVTENDSLYYHSAILITFDLGDHGRNIQERTSDAAEAMIYTPHGIHAEDLQCLRESNPPLRVLGLMHGLHDVKLSKRQLNLGGHNGLQAQRICEAKYWVSTHDEVKKARGLIAPILRRKTWTLKEVLEHERGQNSSGSLTNSDLAGFEGVQFAELKSGESLDLM